MAMAVKRVEVELLMGQLEKRVERVARAQAAFEKNQEEIARLQGFVDRFGAKTMGASMAQSRLKQIEKLEKEGGTMGDPTKTRICLSLGDHQILGRAGASPFSLAPAGCSAADRATCARRRFPPSFGGRRPAPHNRAEN